MGARTESAAQGLLVSQALGGQCCVRAYRLIQMENREWLLMVVNDRLSVALRPQVNGGAGGLSNALRGGKHPRLSLQLRLNGNHAAFT